MNSLLQCVFNELTYFNDKINFLYAFRCEDIKVNTDDFSHESAVLKLFIKHDLDIYKTIEFLDNISHDFILSTSYYSKDLQNKIIDNCYLKFLFIQAFPNKIKLINYFHIYYFNISALKIFEKFSIKINNLNVNLFGGGLITTEKDILKFHNIFYDLDFKKKFRIKTLIINIAYQNLNYEIFIGDYPIFIKLFIMFIDITKFKLPVDFKNLNILKNKLILNYNFPKIRVEILFNSFLRSYSHPPIKYYAQIHKLNYYDHLFNKTLFIKFNQECCLDLYNYIDVINNKYNLNYYIDNISFLKNSIFHQIKSMKITLN